MYSPPRRGGATGSRELDLFADRPNQCDYTGECRSHADSWRNLRQNLDDWEIDSPRELVRLFGAVPNDSWEEERLAWLNETAFHLIHFGFLTRNLHNAASASGGGRRGGGPMMGGRTHGRGGHRMGDRTGRRGMGGEHHGRQGRGAYEEGSDCSEDEEYYYRR